MACFLQYGTGIATMLLLAAFFIQFSGFFPTGTEQPLPETVHQTGNLQTGSEWTFNPTSRAYANLDSNWNDQNFLAISTIPTGLVFWMKADDDLSDGMASDSSGNNNNAACQTGNCPTYLAIGGQDGSGAYQFNGNNYFSFANPAPLVFSKPATVTAWIKTTSDTPQAIFSTGNTSDTTNHWFTISIGNGTTNFLTNELISILSNSSAYYRLGYTTSNRNELFDGQWHFIAVTFDSTVKIYLDGNQKTVTIGSGSNNGTFDDVGQVNSATIGTETSGGQKLNATTNDLRIYNKALTETEIQTLYNQPPSLTANAGQDKTIIPGGSTTLDGSASGGTSPYTYSWTPTTGLNNPSIATPTASPTTTTTYTLTITDSSTPTPATATDTVTVTVQPPTASLTVTPATGLTSSGNVGGPFSPSYKEYTLTNNGTASLNWTITKNQSWLDVNKTSGTLTIGANETIKTALNSNVNNLTTGNYSDTITFTNTTNGQGNTTRNVSLNVSSGSCHVNNPSPLAVNLSSYPYWSSEIPFKNIFRQSGTTWNLYDYQNYQVVNEPLNVDNDDYPTEIPANRWVYANMLLHQFVNYPNGTSVHVPYPSGRYVVLYDGEGTMNFTGDATNVVRTAEGRYTFDVFTTSTGGIPVYIKTTNPANHIRNIRIVRDIYENNYTTEPFQPEFVSFLEDFRTVRFMNWMLFSREDLLEHSGTSLGATSNTITLATSASNSANYYNGMVISTGSGDRRYISAYDGVTKIATVSANWSQLPSAASYYIYRFPQKEWATRVIETNRRLLNARKGGTPVETMVKLANTANISPWFTIPTEASDDYVRQFATYVKNNLNPTLRVYIEYSNENWNYGYPGYYWSVAKGAELGIGAWDYSAYRSVQIFKIFNEVFNESDLRVERNNVSRLVRLLPCQNAYLANCIRMMDYAGANLPGGTQNPFAPGTNASSYGDALAIAPYFSSPVGISSNDYLTKSVDELIAIMKRSVDAQFNISCAGVNPSDCGITLQNVLNARERGLDVHMYEGGQEMSLSSKPAGWTDTQYNDAVTKLYNTNRDPGMKGLYLYAINLWKSVGLDTNGKGAKLWNQFVDTGYCSKYGCWGARESQLQSITEAPKWQALVEFKTNNTPWWNEGIPC